MPGTTPIKYYYATDQIGSVRRVFASNNTTPAYAYDPYGAPLQSTAPVMERGYAGMLRDPDSGLSMTLYRAYNPLTGRWLSRDPVGEGADPGGNLYAYVGSDAVNLNDPLGLCPNWAPKTPCTAAGCKFPDPKTWRLMLEPKDWCGSTGTGWVPDSPGGADISKACKNHDECYGSPTSRYICDLGLLVDSYNMCRTQGGANGKCASISTLYFLGVRVGGYFSYSGSGKKR